MPETGLRETTTGEARKEKVESEEGEAAAGGRADASGGGFPVVWLAAGVLAFACAAIFLLVRRRAA